MADFLFKAADHDEAIEFIAGKSVVTRDVFNELLPELRSRAFVVTGVDAADAVQAIRDRIADLPAGSTWDAVKHDIAARISPHFIDPDADPDERDAQVNASNRRAELLLRTHGFQACQTAAYDVMDRQRDVMPYWQYHSMEDGRVRPTHAALNGVVLPANSSFWQRHFPPWQFGCRCQVVPLQHEDMQDIKDADAHKPVEQQRVLEGPVLGELEQNNRLVRGPNQITNVAPPEGAGSWQWHPGDRGLTVDQLRGRYDADIFDDFEKWARATKIDARKTVWKWIGGDKPPAVPAPAAPLLPEIPYQDEVAWRTGQPQPGTLGGIDFAPAPPKFWEKAKDVKLGEPKPLRPVKRAGVLIKEADGRIWIVQPTNAFGSRNYTLPGGGVEPGLTNQQNALKEVWEETGLQVELTGYLGDFIDSNNGNNGRLYLGKRVGGAPWDAKIESFIIDRKTGQPAAESEAVQLVTPDRAAQLLHRSDDLAQLATVRPINSVTTPVKFTAKVLSGLEASAKDFQRIETAAGRSPGSPLLHVVQERRGFNALPKVVGRAEADAAIAAGGVEMLRACTDHGQLTAADFVREFKTGAHFPGFGMYGDGTYADAAKGTANHTASGRYGTTIMRFVLPKTAKVIKISELMRALGTNYDRSGGWSSRGQVAANYVRGGLAGSSPHPAFQGYVGVHAALAGYDAIEQDVAQYGLGYHIILNRAALLVQDTLVPRGWRVK